MAPQDIPIDRNRYPSEASMKLIEDWFAESLELTYNNARNQDTLNHE